MSKKALARLGLIVLLVGVIAILGFQARRSHTETRLEPLSKYPMIPGGFGPIDGPSHLSLFGPDALVRYGMKIRTRIFELDGRLRWSFEQARPQEREVTSAMAGRVLVVGTYAGNLYAFDEQGSQLWSFRLAGPPAGTDNWGYYCTASAADSGRILVSETTGLLTALDLMGNELWSQSVSDLNPLYGAMECPDGTIYAVSNHSELIRLSSAGQELWRTAARSEGWIVPCAVPDGSALLASGAWVPGALPNVLEHYADGCLMATTPVQVDLWREPLVDIAGSQIYWLLDDRGKNELLATDYGGKPLWRQPVNDPQTTGTILSDGRLCLIERKETSQLNSLPGPIGQVLDAMQYSLDRWHATLVIFTKSGSIDTRRDLDFDSAMFAPLELAGQQLLVVDEQGTLRCYDLRQIKEPLELSNSSY